MKLGREFENIKNNIENIEQIFDKDIKVIYRLSDSEKDVYLVDYDGVKLKLRIIEESEIEIKRIMLLSKIQNPNIEKIVYYKIADNKIYLLSNYFPGSTLFDYVNEKGMLNEKEATIIVKKLLYLLKCLHHIKPYPLIFRDLQPKNIIINDEEVFLIDIETIIDYRPGKSFDTVLKGTVGFMAPEQYGFGQADTKTDIYNSGMCFHYMLSGEILEFHNQTIDFSKIKISSNVVKVLRKMTEFSPGRRYQSVDKIIEILEKKGRNNRLIEKASFVIVISIAIILCVFGMGNIYNEGEYSQLIDNAKYQQSFGNAEFTHMMPLKLSMFNYHGDFKNIQWYPLSSISDDNNDKSSLEMMYSIIDNNIYIRYKLLVKENMKNISFSFTNKKSEFSSYLVVDLPKDNYDFIQQYDFDELNEILKEYCANRYIMEVMIGEESSEHYNIDFHQIFLENYDRLELEKHNVSIEIYDYFEENIVNNVMFLLNRETIISEEGKISVSIKDWENKIIGIFPSGYLSQKINLVAFEDKTYRIPVLKYKTRKIQGLINECLSDESITNVRMYLVEKNNENLNIIINRKDYVFKDTQYYTFKIEPYKEYIIAYKVISGNVYNKEGYLGKNGNVQNIEEAEIITTETIKSKSYNLNLSDD